MTRRLPRPPAVAFFFFGLLLLAASSAQAAYSAATTNGFFIFAGRVAGQGDALFRTDVWLFNPASAEGENAVVTLVFREQVTSGGGASPAIMSDPIVLARRETKFFPDVTFTTPVPAGDNRVGSLEWISDRPIMASARVYNVTSEGTFGFFLPGIPVSESMGAKTSSTDVVNVLQMYGVNSGDPANFRTGLDVVNTSNVAVPIQVRVVHPTNNLAFGGNLNFSIAPKSLYRVGAVLTLSGAEAVDGLRITVAIPEDTPLPGGGGILAVATTLDNRTNDAFAFVGQRQSETIVPAALLPLSDLP